MIAGRLAGEAARLEETSVDVVPCLKAFAVCGFLTCQPAILGGLGESYRLGDGPPWIYAEHTPNKKMQRARWEPKAHRKVREVYFWSSDLGNNTGC